MKSAEFLNEEKTTRLRRGQVWDAYLQDFGRHEVRITKVGRTFIRVEFFHKPMGEHANKHYEKDFDRDGGIEFKEYKGMKWV